METVLITGANGEIGHHLIKQLSKVKDCKILALDIREIGENLHELVDETIVADINNVHIIESLLSDHNISTIFHLAAILSTSAEKEPEQAIQVNAQGTAKLLEAANKKANEEQKVVKFIFPSTIAVYGLPGPEAKKKAGLVKEEDFQNPITIYGITKLYCEKLGIYYSDNYKLLEKEEQKFLDFRALRFPGIISALTMPNGGTSDYAPEMIHSAAQGQGYESYVRPDTKIPFMVMPDAINAIVKLTAAPREKLTRHIYNVHGFSVTAAEIAEFINQIFPDSSISYNPDNKRQKIVDSWPEQIDDSAAKTDWGWQSEFDLQKSFQEYLIPEIRSKYDKSS